MKTTYRTQMNNMSDENLLDTINHLHRHLFNDFGTTPNLTKLSYAEKLAEKRGITKSEITEYCNNHNK